MSTYSAIPKAYRIRELAKGHYPYRFLTPQTLGYVGKIPLKEMYGYENWPQQKSEDFLQWYEEEAKKPENQHSWNHEEQLAHYRIKQPGSHGGDLHFCCQSTACLCSTTTHDEAHYRTLPSHPR